MRMAYEKDRYENLFRSPGFSFVSLFKTPWAFDYWINLTFFRIVCSFSFPRTFFFNSTILCKLRRIIRVRSPNNSLCYAILWHSLLPLPAFVRSMLWFSSPCPFLMLLRPPSDTIEQTCSKALCKLRINEIFRNGLCDDSSFCFSRPKMRLTVEPGDCNSQRWDPRSIWASSSHGQRIAVWILAL